MLKVNVFIVFTIRFTKNHINILLLIW